MQKTDTLTWKNWKQKFNANIIWKMKIILPAFFPQMFGWVQSLDPNFYVLHFFIFQILDSFQALYRIDIVLKLGNHGHLKRKSE